MNQRSDIPTSLQDGVTMDEAVGKLVNLDYVPAGFTLLDMTSAFAEEAAANYENARIEGISGIKLYSLKAMMEVSKHRHELALALIEAISLELRTQAKSSLLLRSTQPHRLSITKVLEWAEDTFGISIPTPESGTHPSSTHNLNTKGENPTLHTEDIPWEDLTIKIYADYSIRWKVKDQDWIMSSYWDMGLIGTRKRNPNTLGMLLLGFALGKKYPPGRKAQAKDKTALSKLRKALCRLTGMRGDPFLSFNDADGWRPRFKVIDDRRNADERAKAKAVRLELGPEPPDYEQEDDAADLFLKGHKGDNQ